MLEILLVSLLAVHLLLVDVAMVGPLACVWLRWRQIYREDDACGRLARALATICIGSLFGGIATGGLLFAARWQHGNRAFFEALALIPASRLWFALAELVFYFFCMAGYCALWNRWRHRTIFHPALAVAASLNLLVHFPALFVMISVLQSRSARWGSPLDRAGYWRLLLDAEVASRVLHVWLAAAAVTGVVVMALGRRMFDNSTQARLTRYGAIGAIVPTLLQIPTGFWLTIELPEAARQPLIGGDLAASGLFALSILLSVQLLHTLATVALGDHEPRQVRRSIALLMILVFLMVGTRWRLQQSTVAKEAFDRRCASGDYTPCMVTCRLLHLSTVAVQ